MAGAKSQLHRTWHGDPYYYCTLKTFQDPMRYFGARGSWKFGGMHLPSLNPHIFIFPQVNSQNLIFNWLWNCPETLKSLSKLCNFQLLGSCTSPLQWLGWNLACRSWPCQILPPQCNMPPVIGKKPQNHPLSNWLQVVIADIMYTLIHQLHCVLKCVLVHTTICTVLVKWWWVLFLFMFFRDLFERWMIWRQLVILMSLEQKHESLHVIVDQSQAECGTSCHKLIFHMAAKFSLCDQIFRSAVSFIYY